MALRNSRDRGRAQSGRQRGLGAAAVEDTLWGANYFGSFALKISDFPFPDSPLMLLEKED